MAITSAIVARLSASLTVPTNIIAAGSYISGARDINRIMPAVGVIPGGAVLSGSGPHDGKAQKDTVTYWVVIVLPYIGDDENHDYPEDTAEQYIHEVKQSLIGWAPGTGYQTFAYAGEPEPEYDAGGFVKFAVTFESGRLTVGI